MLFSMVVVNSSEMYSPPAMSAVPGLKVATEDGGLLGDYGPWYGGPMIQLLESGFYLLSNENIKLLYLIRSTPKNLYICIKHGYLNLTTLPLES